MSTLDASQVPPNGPPASPPVPQAPSPQASSPQGPGPDYRMAVAPLLHRTFWLRAYAWFHGAVAVLLTMTFIGVVVAWAFAWVAFLVNRAANLADEARRTGNPVLVTQALDKLALHFLVQMALLVEMALLAALLASWLPDLGHGLPGGLSLPGIPPGVVPGEP